MNSKISLIRNVKQYGMAWLSSKRLMTRELAQCLLMCVVEVIAARTQLEVTRVTEGKTSPQLKRVHSLVWFS